MALFDRSKYYPGGYSVDEVGCDCQCRGDVDTSNCDVVVCVPINDDDQVSKDFISNCREVEFDTADGCDVVDRSPFVNNPDTSNGCDVVVRVGEEPKKKEYNPKKYQVVDDLSHNPDYLRYEDPEGVHYPEDLLDKQEEAKWNEDNFPHINETVKEFMERNSEKVYGDGTFVGELRKQQAAKEAESCNCGCKKEETSAVIENEETETLLIQSLTAILTSLRRIEDRLNK
jgi:hypothetical protein